MNNPYSNSWKPQDVKEAIYQIAPRFTDDEKGFWESGKRDAERMLSYCSLFNRSIIVDYGCGIGRVLRYMKGAIRVGVDASEEMLRIAFREWAGERNDVVLARTQDGVSIPLKDGEATFVYSLITLQHMDYDDTERVCLDISRVLCKSGEAYLSFSSFGKIEAQRGATISRDDIEWTGDKENSRFSPNQVLRYSKERLDELAKKMSFEKYSIVNGGGTQEFPYIAIYGRK
jgi:SAM-dependent methyltransferase